MNTIHDEGVAVIGRYMGVPINGIVAYSRQHTINGAMFLVDVDIDQASQDRLEAAGYASRKRVTCTVSFDGQTDPEKLGSRLEINEEKTRT
jgi:hypothetical protein